jgi:dinuclear metal center YbgI/SA1388 family protein
MTTLGEILDLAEELWPKNLAEEWDAPGLVAGDPKNVVNRALLSVDITDAVLTEAIELGCQLIISHHPFLLRPVNSIAVGTSKGGVLTRAIENKIALFAAHTNSDVVEDGVSHTFARQLGLTEIRPLVSLDDSRIGHGRVGRFEGPVKLGELALALARLLPPTATGIRVSGDYEQLVKVVALCGGAGDSFIPNAIEANADVYITSDLRHHVVQEAREKSESMSIVDVSHWSSESLWLPVAAKQLSQVFAEVDFVVSEVRSDPWDFTVTQ